MTTHTTLIISDIHLGSTLSNAERVLAFLKEASFDRLILLGDIFDGTHSYRFKEIDWTLLSYLQKMKSEGKEVVWVRGNHDVTNRKIMEHLKGVHFVNSYSWQAFGKVYYAVHGHQFDRMAIKKPAIKKITGLLHSLFAAYMRHKKTARFFDKLHTKVRGMSEKISSGALEYAQKNTIDYIFCAHTHVPIHLTARGENNKQVHYFNTGSWIRNPSSYISIEGEEVKMGEVSL